MTNAQLQELVCQQAKQGYADRLFAGTSGNLSAYDQGRGIVAITPSGLPYERMEPHDIVLLAPDGTLIEGVRPSSEWPMHLALYRLLPAARALVHTHSPNATAFAVAARPIPAALIEMLFFLLGDVPVAPYAPPGSAALGLSAAAALQDRGACLLQNHGVVAVGADMAEAYLRAIYTEDAAKICRMAAQLGSITTISEGEQERIRKTMGVG